MITTKLQSAVKVSGLRKSFGTKVILDDVDLDIPTGSVFALLGPNGAGKTTTIRILSTLLAPDAGQVTVAGFDVCRDPDAVRRAIGVTGQFSAVDNLLTGEENLALMTALHHVERGKRRGVIRDLLERFDLVDAASQGVATYSGGMRRRLDLAMTLVGDPQIIFLDEPTTGLDPRSRHTMWQIVRELVASGTTVLLTTQNLDEADELANRVAVLDHGRLVAEGTPDELKRRIPGGHARFSFRDHATLVAAASILDASSRDDEGLVMQVATDGSPESLMSLLDRLERHSVHAERVTVNTPDLDDVFFALTGRPNHTEEETR